MENCLYTIKVNMDKYTKVERKVAQFILEQPQKVIRMSTQSMADEVGVSTAAITRFGKNMSDSGFPGLKLELAAEIQVDQSMLEEIDPNDNLKITKQKLTMRIQHTIEESNKTLDERVTSAAIAIEESKMVYVYGLGASEIVAKDFQQKFIRVGKSVMETLDTHLIAVGMSQLKERTILFLISNSGENQDAIRLANLAKQQAIKVIVLTHNKKSALAKLADIVLEHDNSGENKKFRSAATTSLIAQLYAVDLIYYSFVSIHFNDSINRLTDSRDIVKKYFTKNQSK
ncbi:MurR/RpiR family transcriptional regulator [Dellaglioa sp. BT-FLS60]